MELSSSYESKLDSTDDSNNIDSNSSDGNARPKFVFPPAPRLCKSANNTSCSVSCQSDSSISDGIIVKSRRRHRRRNPKILPPIGVFWDIENCQVPKNKSASSIVQKIREIFFDGYREAEFLVVCDVKKENAQIVQDLHDAQVNLIHVSSTSKNAADEKLRQSLRRYAETHPAPSAAILISGDINFAADLSDLRYRKKIHVILVHNANVADALILCANESYKYSTITENLPELRPKFFNQYEILISRLPIYHDRGRLKSRLKYLSDNCGGRVINVNVEKGTAVLRFSSFDFALRLISCDMMTKHMAESDLRKLSSADSVQLLFAFVIIIVKHLIACLCCISHRYQAQRRLKGEDVFGYKIRVGNPTNTRDSPCRSYTGRKAKSADIHQVQTFTVPPPGYPVQDAGVYYSSSQGSGRDYWKSFRDQDAQTKAALSDSGMFRSSVGLPNLMNVSHQSSWLSTRSSFGERRTVQDEMSGACALSNRSLRKSDSVTSIDYTDESKMFYQCGNTLRNAVQSQPNTAVELVISSLDPSIDIKDLRKILTNLLKEYVMILSLNVSTQADGSPIASVKVSSQQEAQYAISQLHHYKLGYKRLTISYAQSNTLDPSQLREMVIALLQEVPGNRTPLFKLIELLESRFHTNVSVSELNKLKDVCRIADELGGRIVSLAPEVRTSPPTNLNRASILYCSVHCPNGLENKGWGEPEMSELPNVKTSLKSFGMKLSNLITTHMGTLPLLSFPVCYELEYGQPLALDDSGVPLEHLVTCVSNVELKFGGPNLNIKYITREIKLKPPDFEKDDALLKGMSSSISSNIQLLCRELVDLLKTTDRCQLLLSRFIPAYHHHFGRQCRVADYGYTKLVDLLESQAISNVVQILGDGSRRMITLTHCTQMRRFTSDLLRVLKYQASKQVTLTEFPKVYERVHSKAFNPVEYGLCTLEDLLDEVPENTVVFSKSSDTITIGIPKREQTAEEIIRTKQFAEEVVKLLYHSPQCSMLFNKFVPAYHHHFGHQCKVSDYGFTKLIELFEAIPDTVRVEELSDGERKVCLTLPRALKVLGHQVTDIIKNSKLASLSLELLSSAYLREYGYPLKPHAYECVDVTELVSKLGDFVRVSQSSAGPLLVLVDSESQEVVAMRVWAILLLPPHRLKVSTFLSQYQMRFQSNVSTAKLEQLTDVISITGGETGLVSLKPLYVLAAQLYYVVYRAGGRIPYTNLENTYRRYYDKNICYADFDTKSMEDLISCLNFVLVIKGTRKRTNVILNQNLAKFGILLPSLNGSETAQYLKRDDSVMQWPPAPAHIVNNADRKITPPKPDTPPSPGSSVWSSWSTPTKFGQNVDLSIPLPTVHTPKLMMTDTDLISPTRNLLSAHSHPLGSMLPVITAPHPTELPKPDMLMGKDDSVDSGVNNSNITSENEMEICAEQNGKLGIL